MYKIHTIQRVGYIINMGYIGYSRYILFRGWMHRIHGIHWIYKIHTIQWVGCIGYMGYIGYTRYIRYSE